jgi:hypothetical protein
VDALKAADFRNSDISVLLPEGAGTKDFAHEKNTKAPEGATTGAGTGALLHPGQITRVPFARSRPAHFSLKRRTPCDVRNAFHNSRKKFSLNVGVK